MTTQTISETTTDKTSLADSKQEIYVHTGTYKKYGILHRGRINFHVSKALDGDVFFGIRDDKNIMKDKILISLHGKDFEKLIAQYIEAKAKLSKENE